MNEHVETLSHIKAAVLDLAFKFGPRAVVAIIIIVVGVLVGRWAGRAIARGLRKFDLEPPVRDLLVRVANILIFGLFAIMALQNLGVELLPLIAGIGVAGAGIALAMQGVLSNVVAGLTIIFTRPFRIGEYIAIVGVEGTVESMGLFKTTLNHPDLSRVVIIVVAKTLLPFQKRTEEATLPPPRDIKDYWTRPYFLNVAFQSAASASSVSLAVPSPPIM